LFIQLISLTSGESFSFFDIGSVLLCGERAEYGKKILATLATLSQDLLKKYSSGYERKIVTTLSTQLVIKCGQTFDIHNILRIIRFAEKFIELRIVTPVATQFSWDWPSVFLFF